MILKVGSVFCFCSDLPKITCQSHSVDGTAAYVLLFLCLFIHGGFFVFCFVFFGGSYKLRDASVVQLCLKGLRVYRSSKWPHLKTKTSSHMDNRMYFLTISVQGRS